jgi:hypothetical protein
MNKWLHVIYGAWWELNEQRGANNLCCIRDKITEKNLKNLVKN